MYFLVSFLLRKRASQAGGHPADLQGLLHAARAHAAGRQPAAPQAALHPGHEPLHGHRPHAHGDRGGHLQEDGAAPVSGHSQRVSRRVRRSSRGRSGRCEPSSHLTVDMYTPDRCCMGSNTAWVYPVICMATLTRPNRCAAPLYPPRPTHTHTHTHTHTPSNNRDKLHNRCHVGNYSLGIWSVDLLWFWEVRQRLVCFFLFFLFWDLFFWRRAFKL